jgi:peptidoglycan hydrolase CwlO-like protein
MLLGWLKEKCKNFSLVTWIAIIIVLIVVYRILSILKGDTATTDSPVFKLEKEKAKIEKELQARQEKALSAKKELEEIKTIQDPDERRKRLADYANRRWQ